MSEFAYVTDGACDVDDMLSLEITLYKVSAVLNKCPHVNCPILTSSH